MQLPLTLPQIAPFGILTDDAVRQHDFDTAAAALSGCNAFWCSLRVGWTSRTVVLMMSASRMLPQAGRSHRAFA